MLCHGCKQTPEEFAQGTRVVELADRAGCVVLLPRQKDTANPWRCWNWFERRTMHGNGEAAIVAAQIRRVRRRYRIDRKRVLVAGMSAGGALAAIMGVRYPGLVSAVAVHSGLACGAATSRDDGDRRDAARPRPGRRADRRGRARDASGACPRAAARDPRRSRSRRVAAQRGGAGRAVPAAQRLPGTADPASSALPAADTEQHATLPDGRTETVREWRRDGQLVVRHVEIGGLGHAWSGGDASLTYNDAGPPDATALVGEFFADAVS